MKPEIKRIVGGPLDVNTYCVSAEGHGVLIDPGTDYDAVRSEIGETVIDAILLTHGHFDHINGANPWLESGARLYVHAADAPYLADPSLNMSYLMGLQTVLPKPDVLVKDGDVLTIGALSFEVLHTPGHTPGGVCYRMGDILFSGDTMFRRSYGRIDLPGGDSEAIVRSLKRLYTLPDETLVCPGHGGPTVIAQERGLVR